MVDGEVKEQIGGARTKLNIWTLTMQTGNSSYVLSSRDKIGKS